MMMTRRTSTRLSLSSVCRFSASAMVFRCAHMFDAPQLGLICISQEIAWQLGGKVKQCDHREYGHAKVQVAKLGNGGTADALLEGLGDELEVSILTRYIPRSRRTFHRSGCRMETSSAPHRQTSMSSAAQAPHPLPPSRTTRVRSMASSSTPKSLTVRAARRSSASSCSTLSDASLRGRWCVHKYTVISIGC